MGPFLIHGTKLSVVELFVVNGGVDHGTGNIISHSPVYIKGYVAPSFSVVTKRSVIVEGNNYSYTARDELAAGTFSLIHNAVTFELD